MSDYTFDSCRDVRGICGRIRKYLDAGAKYYLSHYLGKEVDMLLQYLDRPDAISGECLEMAELFVSRYNDMVADMDAVAFKAADELKSILDAYPVRDGLQSRVRGRIIPSRRIASSAYTNDLNALDSIRVWLDMAVDSDSVATKLEWANNVIQMLRKLDVRDLQPETGRFAEDSLAALEGVVDGYLRAVDDAVSNMDGVMRDVSQEAGTLDNALRLQR